MLLGFVSVGAQAAGTAYHSSPRTFKGTIAVVSASDHASVGEAFIATSNAPTSSAQLAMRLIEPESVRRLDTTDSNGNAKLFILPLGVFSVWKPGYWPEEIKFKVRSSRPIDANGTMTVELKPASASEKTAAARKAAELFGLIRKDGQVSTFANAENDPSEHVRTRLRKIFQEAGVLPAAN